MAKNMTTHEKTTSITKTMNSIRLTAIIDDVLDHKYSRPLWLLIQLQLTGRLLVIRLIDYGNNHTYDFYDIYDFMTTLTTTSVTTAATVFMRWPTTTYATTTVIMTTVLYNDDNDFDWYGDDEQKNDFVILWPCNLLLLAKNLVSLVIGQNVCNVPRELRNDRMTWKPEGGIFWLWSIPLPNKNTS
jgi:hypothetical protein